MKKIIIGIDEAGRWPWAWPVVAGACVFLKNTRSLQTLKHKLDDSKKLSEKQRDALTSELMKLQAEGIIATGVGIVESSIIDTIGIKKANKLAMQQALEKVLENISISKENLEIQIDGNDRYSLHDEIPSLSIIRWDAKVKQISAASILAKVTRDHLMSEYGKTFPGYAFEIHKWYGTKRHSEALETLGICAIHRKSYAPIRRIIEKNWF